MATYYDSPKTTYSMTTDPEARIRVISDVINLIDPMETPLLSLLGGLDSAKSKFKIRGNGTKIEWMEDSYVQKTVTASTDVASTTAATTITLTDSSIVKVGSVLLQESEYYLVTANDLTANTIVVTRGYQSSTAAAHVASTKPIEIITNLTLEGADATYDAMMDLLIPFNYTQIFRKGMKMSGTEMAVDEYGYSDGWAYQANKKMTELFIDIEKALFHTVKAAGTLTTYRKFGGIGSFIGNTTAITTAITKTSVDDLSELIKLDGGNPDVLMVHPSVARDMKDIIDTSSFVNLSYENTRIGMSPVKTVYTQFGSLRLIENRHQPISKAYMLDSRKMGMYTLRPFGWHELGRHGDYDAAEVLGEVTLVMVNPDAHGTITGITT